MNLNYKIYNLKLDDNNYIKDLMNLNNEFLLILTKKYLIQYDLHKREILYSCELSLFSVKNWTATKNYLFLYERSSGVIIFDKKTINPIQSKYILNIFLLMKLTMKKLNLQLLAVIYFVINHKRIKFIYFLVLGFFLFFCYYFYLEEK